MSDHLRDLKPEDVLAGERPPAIPSELPILPLRDTVLFPNSFMPLAVARESSVRLIDDATWRAACSRIVANADLSAAFFRGEPELFCDVIAGLISQARQR